MNFPVATVYAQSFTNPIVPNCGADCGVNDFYALMQNIVNFSIYLATIVFVLILMYVGFLLVTNSGNPGKLAEAKKIVTAAVIGFVVVLGATLIVDTILSNFATEDAQKAASKFSGGVLNPATSGGGGGVSVTNPIPPDGSFEYQIGIAQQRGDASAKLNSLLSCMANKVPGDVGVISSISDSLIISGQKTFEECAQEGKQGGCAHTKGSAHYGYATHIGKSYAVDFGDEQHAGVLSSAARSCGASKIFNEGNHVHVQVAP